MYNITHLGVSRWSILGFIPQVCQRPQCRRSKVGSKVRGQRTTAVGTPGSEDYRCRDHRVKV